MSSKCVRERALEPRHEDAGSRVHSWRRVRWSSTCRRVAISSLCIPRYTALSTQGNTGDNLIAKAGGGLVFVSMEYRLGAFGFLPGSEVKAKGALNAGLRTSRLARPFVDENVDA